MKNKGGGRFSVLMVLVFVFSLLFPSGIALADGCEISSTVQPGIKRGEDHQDLGWIRINEIENCDWLQVEMNLPEGVEWDIPMNAGNVADYIYLKDKQGNIIDDGLYISSDESGYKVRFDNPLMFEDRAQIRAIFNNINVAHKAPENICPELNITGIEDGLTAWEVKSSESVSPGEYKVDIGCSNPKVIQGSGKQFTGKIKFQENNPGALQAGDSFTLTLPSGCEWEDVDAEKGRYGLEADTSIDEDVLKVEIIHPSASVKDGFSLQGKILVIPSFPEDHITAEIEGTLDNIDFEDESLLIARKGTPTVTLRSVDSSGEKIYPASYNNVIDEIKFTSNGTMEAGSKIILTLPDGLYWYDTGFTGVEGAEFIDFYDDNQSAWFEVSEAVDELVLEGLKVAVLPDAPTGEIAVNIDGDYNGQVTAGMVESVASASAVVPKIEAGALDQAAGDIIIVENSVNSFTPVKNGTWHLSLSLPAGVTFAAEPEVLVNGSPADVSLHSETLSNKFEKGKSKLFALFADGKAFRDNREDEISIKNLKYNLDTRVAAGDLQIELGGYMFNKLFRSGNSIVPQLETKYADKAVSTVVNAVVDRSGISESSMRIGSNEMYSNGEKLQMDVAPYIKNDRTYLPVRYVAYALGMNDDDIDWDENTQTVSLVKGDTAVQLQIGSDILQVNDNSQEMDVSPEIVQDRTMLPVRFIAEAFGADVLWDQVTQTVTFNI